MTKKRPFSSDYGGKRVVNPDDAKRLDANVLMAQYRTHGTLPSVRAHQPLYGDFTSDTLDLQRATEMVQQAEDRFAELPASVRTAAENNPVKFLQMFDDPDQRDMLLEAGLKLHDENGLPITPTPKTPPSELSPPPESGSGAESPRYVTHNHDAKAEPSTEPKPELSTPKPTS